MAAELQLQLKQLFSAHPLIIKIFNFIHEYSIKFEENIFRKDYFLKYLQVLISEK